MHPAHPVEPGDLADVLRELVLVRGELEVLVEDGNHVLVMLERAVELLSINF